MRIVGLSLNNFSIALPASSVKKLSDISILVKDGQSGDAWAICIPPSFDSIADDIINVAKVLLTVNISAIE